MAQKRASSSSKAACPSQSLFDDKEFNENSFVVLSSLKDLDKFPDDILDPISTIVEETKQLINIEPASEPTEHYQKTEINLETEKNLQSNQTSEMNQNTVLPELPKMPQVERGTDTLEVISFTTASTDLTTKETEKKILEVIKENLHLKDIILQNNKTMKSNFKKVTAWQEEILEQYQSYKDKITEHKNFSDELEKENSNFIHELNNLKEIKKQQDKELISLKQTLKEQKPHTYENLFQNIDGNITQFELNLANKKIKELETVLESVTSDNINLKDVKNNLLKQNNFKIDECEKEIEKLVRLLDVSKDQVEKAKLELLKVKSLEEEKQDSLKEVIRGLRQQLSSVTTQYEIYLEEKADICQQLTNTKTVLIQAEQSRASAYSQIETLNNEIIELRKQLYDTQSQTDDISALRIQLDVYKADFENERNSKEALEAENEKFFEDMQNLQRRNQELLNEIKKLQKEHVYSSHSRADASISSTSKLSKCPKCNFGFSSRQDLEKHVSRCFELNDPFS